MRYQTARLNDMSGMVNPEMASHAHPSCKATSQFTGGVLKRAQLHLFKIISTVDATVFFGK